jgi:hypothetical protein
MSISGATMNNPLIGTIMEGAALDTKVKTDWNLLGDGFNGVPLHQSLFSIESPELRKLGGGE